MSLKTRLRFAISTLMAAVVVALSLLYIQAFFSNELTRTSDTAKSISGQVQGAIRARLDRVDIAGLSPDETKRRWLKAIEKDEIVTAILRRELENWRLITAVYISDADGKVIASTDAGMLERRAPTLESVDEWSRRTLLRNAEDIYFGNSDMERAEPLAIRGEQRPFITAHVLISLTVLRDTLSGPIEGLGMVFVVSLIIAIFLAVLLPNFVVNPLERLTERLDLMTTGKPLPLRSQDREAKEFAAVYSKLDVLGQQYRGAREETHELQTNFQHLLERLEHAVLLVDPAGNLMMAGRNAGVLLGVAPEQLNGRPLTELAGPDSELGSAVAECTQTNLTIRDRAVSINTPAGPRTLSISCEPLVREPDQRPIGTLILLRDLDTRQEIEAELGIADRLAALSRLTRGVAHEIKNPLNAITLHLEMLRNRIEENAPELDVIGREISRLDRVVKTFLDFNRPITPQMRLMNLSDVGEELGRLVQPQAAAKQIRVDLDLNACTLILGDRDLVQQAVLNVVMNAIDAMPAGGTLTIKSHCASGKCTLSVIDTGQGIPLEVQDRIFALYFSTKRQGSGIGLAIAFRFVQLHDGKLEFFTETGRGTTFRFTFPEAVSFSRTSEYVSRSHGA